MAILLTAVAVGCSDDDSPNDTVDAGSEPADAARPTPGAAPVLTALAPSQGGLEGGELVVLDGSGLDTVHDVRFGTTDFTFSSPQTVTVRTPPHAAGSVTVGMTVINGASASPNAFTYVAP